MPSEKPRTDTEIAELTIKNHGRFLKRFRALEDAQENVNRDKETLLRDSGWKYSSSYADCYWRWSKTIEGKQITTMNADEALRLENRITPCNEDCKHED